MGAWKTLKGAGKALSKWDTFMETSTAKPGEAISCLLSYWRFLLPSTEEIRVPAVRGIKATSEAVQDACLSICEI